MGALVPFYDLYRYFLDWDIWNIVMIHAALVFIETNGHDVKKFIIEEGEDAKALTTDK